MRYRDHMNLGAVIYIPFLSKAYMGTLPEALFVLMPFYRALQHSSSWIPGAAAYFFFSIGCCLPDIDIAWYPNKGHRVKSPAHNLMIVLAAYVMSAGLCLLPVHGSIGLVLMMISSLLFGCLAHLAGDFIQGGVGWGIIKKKRIGFTGLKWDIYSETTKGALISIAIAAAAFLSWWTVLNMHPSHGVISPYAITASAIIWLYAILTCRSYSRYLASALTAVLLFATASAIL